MFQSICKLFGKKKFVVVNFPYEIFFLFALARRPGSSGLTALAVSDSGRCVSMTSCLVCRRSDTCIRVGVQGTPRQTVWHSPAFTHKVEKWWMATGRDRKFGMNGGL